MSVEFYRGSPGKFDSRTLNRVTLKKWTGRISTELWFGSAQGLCFCSVPIPRGIRFVNDNSCCYIHIRIYSHIMVIILHSGFGADFGKRRVETKHGFQREHRFCIEKQKPHMVLPTCISVNTYTPNLPTNIVPTNIARLKL